jgi:hypothetical protein
MESESAAGCRRWADINRARADHAAGLLLLERVSDPARRAGDGEDGRECLAWQADGLEQKRGVHLDVGFKPAPRLVARQRGDDPLRYGEGAPERMAPLARELVAVR